MLLKAARKMLVKLIPDAVEFKGFVISASTTVTVIGTISILLDKFKNPDCIKQI